MSTSDHNKGGGAHGGGGFHHTSGGDSHEQHGGGFNHGGFDHGRRRTFFFGGSTTPPTLGQGFVFPQNNGASSNSSDHYNPQSGYNRPGVGHPAIAKASGPGWFDGIIKQFYDPKNGGFQLGGALGALGGAMLGMSFLGTGSWLGIIAMGVMTLAGAWGGNKLTSTIGSYINSATTPEPVKPKTAGTSASVTTQPDAPQKPISLELMQQAQRAAASPEIKGDGENHPQIQSPVKNVAPATQETNAPKAGK